MKVVELTAHAVRIPLRRPIRHASHVRDSTDNLVVVCRLEDGTVGHGEGVPRDYVTGETIDTAVELLARSDLSARLTPCPDFESAVALCQRFRPADVPGDGRGIQGNAARCAVELALLDAYGRRYRRPLSDVTAAVAPEVHQPRPRVRYSGAITSARGIKLRLSAWAQWVYGFAQMKIKVGIEGYDDASRLRTARRILGRSMDVRIDANEAWTPDEAAGKIEALAGVGLSSVEQPLPHEQADRLAELRRAVKVPIMLDESLCGEEDARRAIEGGLCDLFNVRLSKCGGFVPSLRLAAAAKAAGLGCQLGCQVGETAILSAAGRHFAASVGGLRYVEGSYDRHLVREALGRADLTFGRGGWAAALGGGGLGVEIDPAALARVTVTTRRLI